MKNRNILTILLVLTIIFTIMGGSLAYYNWQTSESQKTVVTFTIENEFSCSADGGGNISSVNIAPTTCTGSYALKRTIKAMPKLSVASSIYMDLWLDINEIGTGLSNSNNFKYALTTSSTSCETGLVTSGTFTGTKAGDKISLLSSQKYTQTMTDTYYLYIWLDSAETSTETMNQSFSLSLNGECTDEAKAYSESILNGAAPELDDGMIPVVIDNSGSETTIKTISKNDSNWYNYESKKWANVVLTTSSSRSKYLDTTDVVVSESDILAYLVWIPRYKYKIWTTTTSSNGSEQTIDIVFEDKTTPKSTGTTVGSYRTHPAFTFGDTELNGIWVGKFETTGDATTPTVKPNLQSLTNQNPSTQFSTAQKFGTSTYGSTSKIDAHMMKNSEWGAVAYLSHSKYGVNREVYINNSSSCYTGRSGGNVGGSTAINTVYMNQTSTDQYNTYGFYTWDGYLLDYNTNTKSSTHDMSKVASTTGNITGVYGMSGGAWEYVMGYYSGASTTWGASSYSNYAGFSSKPDSKYYDDYTSDKSLTACNGGICYGHALSETANWYSDYAFFVGSTWPWFGRGGSYSSGASSAGAFYSNGNNGGANGNISFRLVLSAA